jgi:hypothetical protein
LKREGEMAFLFFMRLVSSWLYKVACEANEVLAVEELLGRGALSHAASLFALKERL